MKTARRQSFNHPLHGVVVVHAASQLIAEIAKDMHP
jgi:hypothetical protein